MQRGGFYFQGRKPSIPHHIRGRDGKELLGSELALWVSGWVTLESTDFYNFGQCLHPAHVQSGPSRTAASALAQVFCWCILVSGNCSHLGVCNSSNNTSREGKAARPEDVARPLHQPQRGEGTSGRTQLPGVLQ